MLNLYYKPHKKRVREAEFVQHLRERFPEANLIEANFPIQPSALDCLVDTRELIAYLEADKLASPKPRTASIEALPKQTESGLNAIQNFF